jgi:hypothetical protein
MAFNSMEEATLTMRGFAVSGNGDINGDGFSDLLIGAPLGAPRRDVGRAYVVFGGEPGRLRISDSHGATYTDPEGDLVTVNDVLGYSPPICSSPADGVGFQLEN